MADGQRATLGTLISLTALPFLILGLFEVLVLGQPGDWFSPRVWIVQAVGLGTLALLSCMAAWLIGRFAGPGLALRLALGSTVSLVFGAHLWPHLSGRVLGFMPPFARLLLVLSVVTVVTAFALRVSDERLRELRGPIAFALGAIVLWTGFDQAAASAFFKPSPWIGIAVSGVYLAGVVGLTLGKRPMAWFGAWGLVGLTLMHTLSLSAQEPKAAVPSPATPGNKPPIFMVIIDTLRVDGLELEDPATSSTPVLAGLAQQAEVYTNAIANASWTLPGHASIFTGRTVSGHRTDATMTPGFVGKLADGVPTLQQILHSQNYRTVGIIANPVVGPGPQLVRGFEQYEHPGHGWLIETLPIKLAFDLSPGSRPQITSQLLVDLFGIFRFATAPEVIDRAVETVESSEGSLYMFLNLMDVHRPYPPASGTSLGTRLRFMVDQMLFWGGLIPELEFEKKYTPLLVDAYAERATVVDAELDRFFAAIKARGWWDEATIIITADHGESFFDNPELPSNYGHHGSYESTVRIPLIIKKPGQTQQLVFENLVQQADLLPTILDVAGLAPVPGATGRALPTTTPSDILTEWHPRPFSSKHKFDRHYPGNRIGVYRDQYKFVLEMDFEERLFDLGLSRWEVHNVLEELPELSKDLRESLYSQILEVEQGSEGEETELDAELESQLRALGYLQ